MHINKMSLLWIVKQYGPGTSTQLRKAMNIDRIIGFSSSLNDLCTRKYLRKIVVKNPAHGNEKYKYQITKEGLSELNNPHNQPDIQSLAEIKQISENKVSEKKTNKNQTNRPSLTLSPSTMKTAEVLGENLQNLLSGYESSKRATQELATSNINALRVNLQALLKEGIYARIEYIGDYAKIRYSTDKPTSIDDENHEGSNEE